MKEHTCNTRTNTSVTYVFHIHILITVIHSQFPTQAHIQRVQDHFSFCRIPVSNGIFVYFFFASSSSFSIVFRWSSWYSFRLCMYVHVRMEKFQSLLRCWKKIFVSKRKATTADTQPWKKSIHNNFLCNILFKKNDRPAQYWKFLLLLLLFFASFSNIFSLLISFSFAHILTPDSLGKKAIDKSFAKLSS